MLTVSESPKRKRKLSSTFFNTQKPQKDDQNEIISTFTGKTDGIKNLKDQLLEEILKCPHRVLTEGKEQMLKLRDQTFIEKYKLNPYFQKKVDLLVEKGKKYEDMKDSLSSNDESDDEEERKIIERHGIASSRTLTYENKHKKQKVQIMEKYHRTIRKMATF